MSADLSQSREKRDMYPSYGGNAPPPYPISPFTNEASSPNASQWPGFAPNLYPNTGFPTAGFASMPPQVIIQQQPAQTVVVGRIDYGPTSMRSICVSCRKDVMTSTKATAGELTWIMCAFLACMCMDCGCCLIPFLTDACKDIEHYCPECGAFMGVHRRGERRYH